MNSSIVAQIKNNLPQGLFKTPAVDQAELPVVAQLVGLSNFELKHVYHLLKSGVALNLRYNHSATSAQQAVEVCYKHFKIGELATEKASVVEQMLLHGFDLKVEITQTEKVKYMPHHRIEVAISDNILF